MASTTMPAMPSLKSNPRPNSPPTKESILSDLRRQLDDSDLSSNAGSTSSRGRRRRRNKNKSALAATAAPVIPRLAEIKPVRLQLGLNLDVELELKARVQGDVSLTLLQ